MIDGLAGQLRRVGRAWSEGRSDAEMHFAGYEKWRSRLLELGFEDLRGVRVLDVGCGSRAQLALLFASEGAEVSALDTLPIALGTARPRMWLAMAARLGLGAALRTVIRDIVHLARYWRRLARLAGAALPFERVRLVEGDAARLPFPDASFDIVVSSAVWEHLPDVESATREVARVLRPRGVAVIQIALFPSLQGGHHADWHSVEPGVPRTVRPWDHLRPGRQPFPTYLNEWREVQYRDVIERCLTVRDWEDDELRGSGYLTPELRSELAAYSGRELLLSGVTVWAGRPDDASRGRADNGARP